MKKKLLIMLFAVVSLVTITSCKKGGSEDSNKKTYSNDEDSLVLSSQEVDGVFNPFFSTSGADSSVVGMTQISMIGNDKDGNPTCGDAEPVVVLDYDIQTTGTANVDQTTKYSFVLKNNVKFSNGNPLTIKDVLFNLYVYLDIAYPGSATIYSTDIVGLKQYRTQEANEKEQDRFMQQFEVEAEGRITYLKQAAEDIFDANKNKTLSEAEFKAELVEYSSRPGYENVVKDYDKAIELFKEEINTDYSNSLDQYEDITFMDKNGAVKNNLFTTDVEVFLYNEGYITFNKDEGLLESSLVINPADLKTWTKEQAINTVLLDKVPNAIGEIVTYWGTAFTFSDFLVNEAMENYFATHEVLFPNISGIQFANRTESVTVKGKEYAPVQYGADGSVSNETNEVLTIEIHDIDPKAIWNFAFAVAPMYYYSDQAHINAFDFESNFGVERGSQTFMTDVVNAKNKVGVPMGAGPYAASKASGGTQNVSSGDFKSMNVIYFERNEHYLMGAPKIKKLRFQVVSSQRMMDVLETGEVDYVEPSAAPENITKLDGLKKNGFGYERNLTSGYGYIGINAGDVPDLAVRQAIMHAIDTMECVNYYKGTAEAIYRSMSTASWAYPGKIKEYNIDEPTAYYPYIGGEIPANLNVVNPAYKEFVELKGKKAGEKFSVAEQSEFLKSLVEGAGYTLNGRGIYNKGSNLLQYKFTIAGAETDHPAWQALYHAQEILNKNGFKIDLTKDPQALSKLASGGLTVWAAAWSSPIDPDMYQVYHKESKATSVKNWGYPQIIQNTGGKYDTEVALLDELSDIIEAARKTNDQQERAELYDQALTLVMQMAIELPTYQRNDLFAYNENKIDVSTFTPKSGLSPYIGLLNRIDQVSFVTER